MPLVLKILLIAALTLALFWALVLWLAARNEARYEAAYPPEGQFLTVGDTRVHYVVMGEGPDLVLIHGSSGMTRDMTYRLAPALADRYRVIVFDRPGLGYSDPVTPNGTSITDQALVISDAARQLGAEKPLIAGHSYGGAVALAWAVNHPEQISGLVTLSAASHPWDTGLTPYYQLLSHPVAGPIVIPIITAFVGERTILDQLDAVFAPFPTPDGYAAHFGPEMTVRRSAMTANALQRRNLLREVVDLSPRYKEVTVPTEILHGADDTAVGLHIHSEPLHAAIDGSVLNVLENQGHMITHTASDDVIAAIDRVAARAGLR
ncbi:MAG: alpha/beta hydrolase [Pseudomonadota bacterium]